MTEFIYLHGFASSPGSKKACAFKKEFERRNIPLIVPDLENGDFENLTLSSQMAVVERIFDDRPGGEFGLIGSSMGGYLAALLAQMRKEVVGMYLMAPGFNFVIRWRTRLKSEWSGQKNIPDLIQVFHYRYNANKCISKYIFIDAEKWNNIPLERVLPTRVIHGIHDDTVPVQESREYAKTHAGCSLIELDSDHGLISHIEWIVNDCLKFFEDQGILH